MFPRRRPHNGAYGYTIPNGIVAGTWNESGGNNSNYLTLTSSIAGPNGSWPTTGWSLGSGGTTAIYSYVGAGTYTVNSTGPSDVTGSGVTAESGGSSTTTGYNSDYDVNAWGGWTEDSDVETSANSGNSHSSNTGNGGYVTPYSGGATVGTWDQDASTNSNYSTQMTSTLNADLTTYTTTGASANGGSDSADDSYDGNGAFLVSAGATTGAGTNSESGEDQSSDNYHGQYTLAANGNWYGVSGAGSSNSYGDTHSGYNGGGVYVSAAGDGNSGTWNESGGSDTNYSNFTNSTLSPFGWGSTGAAGNGGTTTVATRTMAAVPNRSVTAAAARLPTPRPLSPRRPRNRAAITPATSIPATTSWCRATSGIRATARRPRPATAIRTRRSPAAAPTATPSWAAAAAARGTRTAAATRASRRNRLRPTTLTTMSG